MSTREEFRSGQKCLLVGLGVGREWMRDVPWRDRRSPVAGHQKSHGGTSEVPWRDISMLQIIEAA